MEKHLLETLLSIEQRIQNLEKIVHPDNKVCLSKGPLIINLFEYFKVGEGILELGDIVWSSTMNKFFIIDDYNLAKGCEIKRDSFVLRKR